jgi:hypothetical protein
MSSVHIVNSVNIHLKESVSKTHQLAHIAASAPGSAQIVVWLGPEEDQEIRTPMQAAFNRPTISAGLADIYALLILTGPNDRAVASRRKVVILRSARGFSCRTERGLGQGANP